MAGTPRQLIDTGLLIERKRRAVRRAVPGADFLMRRAAEDLAERLATVGRRFGKAATLFCGNAGRAGCRACLAARPTRRSASRPMRRCSAERQASSPRRAWCRCEPASIDLAVSLLSLQDENDIPGMLIQIRRALKPDGLFLGALAGSGTLAELRDSLLAAEVEMLGGASPRVLPFADVREAGALLQRAGFALPVTDVETVTVRYATMFDLMARPARHGRDQYAVAIVRARPATRALLMRAAAIYAERYSDPDGRIRATFSMIWLSGWAPDASQQKPLRPGSAQISLTKVLRREIRADVLVEGLLKGAVLVGEHALHGIADSRRRRRRSPAREPRRSIRIRWPLRQSCLPRNRRTRCMSSLPCSPGTVRRTR